MTVFYGILKKRTYEELMSGLGTSLIFFFFFSCKKYSLSPLR